jgi:hypothetical protein
MSRLLDYVEYGQAIAATSGGVQASDTGAKLKAHIKREVNESIRQIIGVRHWDFMYRTGGGRTWPVIDDDAVTATVTAGEREVTLSSAVLSKAYERGIIEITSTGEDTFRYPIDDVTSTTTFNLLMRWPYDTEASLACRIWQPRYPLPYDMGSILLGSVRMEGVNHPLYRIDRHEIEYRMGAQGWTGGDPNQWTDDFWEGHPIWAHDISPVASTVSVTADSVTLGGANLAFDNALLKVSADGDVLEGWTLKVHSTAKSYLNGIKVVSGATAAELAQKYRGATEATRKYEIGGQGTRILEFYPPPERSAIFAYLYYSAFHGLYNDNDESPIPSRWDGVVNSLLAARILFHKEGDESTQRTARSHLRAYAAQLEDMESEDHPHADHPGYLRDNGLRWEFFGLDPDFPWLAGYTHFAVSS